MSTIKQNIAGKNINTVLMILILNRHQLSRQSLCIPLYKLCLILTGKLGKGILKLHSQAGSSSDIQIVLRDDFMLQK